MVLGWRLLISAGCHDNTPSQLAAKSSREANTLVTCRLAANIYGLVSFDLAFDIRLIKRLSPCKVATAAHVYPVGSQYCFTQRPPTCILSAASTAPLNGRPRVPCRQPVLLHSTAAHAYPVGSQYCSTQWPPRVPCRLLVMSHS